MMSRWLNVLRLRLRSLFRPSAADASLRREIDLHLAEQIDEYRALGLDAQEARARARRDFGSISVIEDACRDERRVTFVSNLIQDLRHSRRSLMRQPLLATAAMASIAIAIAANTSVLSLASEILLAPPTVRNDREVVRIRLGGGSHAPFRRWLAVRDSGTLAGVAGYRIETEINWRRGDETVSLLPMIVTANYFDVLGVPLAQGRGFTADEADVDRTPRIVVVSDGFWRGRLDSDPGAVGRMLIFNGRPYTIVGILRRDVRSLPGYGLAPEIYMPMSREVMPAIGSAEDATIELVGRLRQGQSVTQAEAALTTFLKATETGADERRATARVYPVSGAGRITEVDVALPFVGVLGIAGLLILAIACANVAGLLLSRGVARRREIAVRAALGAGRGRLVQQLLADGIWLAIAGTAAGVVLMVVFVTLLSRVSLPLPMPIEFRPSMDSRMFGASLLLVAITALLCGLLPAVRATRLALVPALKNEGPAFSRRRFTLHRLLVSGQVAFAAMLLVTAFLFLRNLTRITEADPGFEVDRTIVARLSLVDGRHTPEAKREFAGVAVEVLKRIPGIEQVSYAHGVPLTIRSGMTTGVDLRVVETGETFKARYETNFVGPAYFATMGIPIRRGREFTEIDRAGAPATVVINERFAQRHFQKADPVGRHLLLPGPNDETYQVEIVGVVGDIRHRTIGEEPQAAIYEAFQQRTRRDRFVHVLLRASSASGSTIPEARRNLQALDPTAAVEVMEMRSALAFAFLPSRIGALLLGIIGVSGLTLASVGLFAVMSFTVSRRTAEIGVRMTLGATRAAVTRLVLGEASVLLGAGLVAGLAASLLVTRPLAMFLVHGLRPDDPVSILATVAVLLATGLAAAWWPSRRAANINPARTLRAD